MASSSLAASARCCPASGLRARAPAASVLLRPGCHVSRPFSSGITSLGAREQSRGPRAVVVRAANDEPPVKYNTEFGYSRKDILLICGGLIGLGYALYYGLQAAGVEAGYAGNWVQLIIFLGICVGWISTYIFRVATKQMTYVKQLEQYEEAVMRKRLDEMTEAELEQLVDEAEAEGKQQRGGRSN